MITNFKIFEGSVKSSDRIDIFRDNKYILVAPLTAEASAKYGADSHWCTSALGNSYLWCEDNIPNHPDSNRGLLILIRRGYVITPENADKSEEYYYLNQEMDGGEIEEGSVERERWLELQSDIDSLDLSKLCITFGTDKNKYSIQVWSANNQDMEIYLNDLSDYGIDYYIIEEIENYIYKVKNRKKELSLSENLQLADKLYFKTGELTDNDRKLILSITGGDNYTKLIADAFHHFKQFEQDKDDWNPNSIRMMKKMYEYIKDYDSNFFPIVDYDPQNIIKPKLHILELFEALQDRENVVGFVREHFDRIYLRNIRDDIRKPRTRWEFVELFNKMKDLRSQFNTLKTINPVYSDKIFKKAFSSKNKTIDSVLQHLKNIKNFLVNDITPNQIREEIKYCSESNIVYEKNKVMIILVGSNQDMVTLGNNTLWCFARQSYDQDYWDTYAQGSHVYIIIDFKKHVTHMYKFVVYLPSSSDFYDMYNELIQDIEDYSIKIGISDIYSLMDRIDNQMEPFKKTG